MITASTGQLFTQLKMWMGLFRLRPDAAQHPAQACDADSARSELVQSTTTDVRDEKSAEDDDEEDELITIRSPQKLSPRNRAEERSRTDWELLIRNKLAQSLRAGLEHKMTLQQAMAYAKEEFISSLKYMDLRQLGEITRIWNLHLEPGDVRYTHLQPHH